MEDLKLEDEVGERDKLFVEILQLKKKQLQELKKEEEERWDNRHHCLREPAPARPGLSSRWGHHHMKYRKLGTAEGEEDAVTIEWSCWNVVMK